MTAPTLVTGGTGTLGRQVVPLLVKAGATVRVLSRHHHDDTADVQHVTGDLGHHDRLIDAVSGAATVVHLAGNAKDNEVQTRNLMRAAGHAGVGHVVFVSVIGAGRVPMKFLDSKFAAEREVERSGLPWTILRAAQFHDLVFTVATALSRSPVVPCPRHLRLQPVDVAAVARRLVALAAGEPAGRVRDLAGPTVYTADTLLRDYLRATGKRRALLPVRLPGRIGRAYRDGENLSYQDTDGGDWADFLADRLDRDVSRRR